MGAVDVITCIVTFILVLFALKPCKAMKIITLDGLTEWKTTTVHVGDSLMFKHKYVQNLYLFHSRKAFEHCMLDEATHISSDMSTNVKWNSTRPGYYYFATMENESQMNCENSEKVSVRVITPDPNSGFPSLPILPTPAPVSGGDISVAPSYAPSWSPVDHSPSSSPSPADTEDSGPMLPRNYIAPATAPTTSTGTDGNSSSTSIPFISSNPAVPLPMGETDSATIQPLLTPGSQGQVAGMGSFIGVQSFLLMMFVVVSTFVIVDDKQFHF